MSTKLEKMQATVAREIAIKSIIDGYIGQIQKALANERNRQLKEKIDAGEDVTTFEVMGIETIRYDRPAIDMVYSVVLDNIFRELAMMELREEITSEERHFIEEEIQ